ncbi:uncharacterized protein wu:fk95d07 [Puntigrus tetrazona]|uniref:uncharacterized protein wu:fk95d07 n=1 Tax=Puntigrus tetrazona TaxID=1606681 RepID=UPI001C8A6E65|nr:uncharacterized protein wu:fk95d07 [Puntigrus tetrazona]
MKPVIVVFSILGLCLSAPVEQDTGSDNEPVINEEQRLVGFPLAQTDSITRNIFIPVPKPENFLPNPYFNYQYPYYSSYPYYPQYPYYPVYSLPPVIISLPQRNP